ncbi:MAG: hypothetical protein JSV92_02480 [archaeon]|nr:MAG: hypothetical protein JSV92_02480 [archaeon]
MHLRWEDYPGISYYKDRGFESIELESPSIRNVSEEVENLGEDEYIIIKGCDFLSESPRKFMKRGPELKIPRKVDSPWRYFPKEFKNLTADSHKRGYSWRNKRSNTTIVVPFSSLFDGLKLYVSQRNEIKAKLYHDHDQKVISGKVKSSLKNYSYTVFENVIQKDGKNFFADWLSYNCSCTCEGNLFNRFTSFKYVNPPHFVCKHGFALYEAARKSEEKIYPLFPRPRKKFIECDENLTRVFVKRRYNERLGIGQRNRLDGACLGLLNEKFLQGLSFWQEDGILKYGSLAQD